MESSNPLVVTKATRAPLRWSSVLVPTVVPCSTTISCALAAILLTASAMACAGSAGVENTFRMRRSESWSQIQSVKVPPLSMAMRRADRCMAVFFGNRIFTLMFGHPERARATVKAKSKDPEGVYATTPQKGALTDLCIAEMMLPYPTCLSERAAPIPRVLICAHVAAKRGICSAGLQGYRETAAEPFPHRSRLTKARPSGFGMAGREGRSILSAIILDETSNCDCKSKDFEAVKPYSFFPISRPSMESR